MEAGRELDALIAEKVMGWTRYTEYVHGPLMHGGGMMTLYTGESATRGGRTWSVDGFKPSVDIAAAWEVLEKIEQEGWHWGIDGGRDGPMTIGFYDKTEGAVCEVSADTVAEAICLAALNAVGYTK